MQVATLEARVEQLTQALGAFSGYRTLWLAPDQELVHAEPELELEEEGYRYVATLMQPDRDALTEALLRVLPLEGTRPAPMAPSRVGWELTVEPDTSVGNLVPA